MNWRLFVFTKILVISAYCLFFVSCSKEPALELTADTTLFAKIYQPDALVGKDAVIESITPDKNFGNASYCTVFSWTSGGLLNNARALIEFDLSAILPQTQIDSARLTFFWTSYDNLIDDTGENDFKIYKITQAWDENSVTWNNQPLVSDLKAVPVPKSYSTNQSYSAIDVTDLVQDMINNPAENHGFMLKLNKEIPYKLVILASSDNADASLRPKLVIYY